MVNFSCHESKKTRDFELVMPLLLRRVPLLLRGIRSVMLWGRLMAVGLVDPMTGTLIMAVSARNFAPA